jgi:hypothetical protein
MYTVENFASKAALKRAVAAGKQVQTFQGEFPPGPARPARPGMAAYRDWLEARKKALAAIALATPATDGKISLEGPHFPALHRWYASAQVTDGVIVPGSIK